MVVDVLLNKEKKVTTRQLNSHTNYTAALTVSNMLSMQQLFKIGSIGITTV